MKYSAIASLEYGSGRILLMCTRFANINTGNIAMSSRFIRRSTQWVSAIGDDDQINVCVIVNDVDDGSLGALDNTENITAFKSELKDLSDNSFLGDFDCLVFFGLDNNISPLIRSNVKQYIEDGGGAIFCDVNINDDSIDMFDDIESVYCISSGVNLSDGQSTWTVDGVNHYLYEIDFVDIEIAILNTISELGFSSAWEILYIYDTDHSVSEDNPFEYEVVGTIYSSSDYDIPGDRTMAYFSCVYENGIFEVK